MKSSEDKKRVFSGIQPSGKLHIGNYVGALSLWGELQDTYENIFCIVDLHALTIPEHANPARLPAQSREVAALYLACGIDPIKNVIFIQSHIPEHTELAWVLNCITPVWDFPHVPCHGHVSSSPRQQVSATMTAPVPLYITSQKPKLLMQKVKPSDARSQPSTAQTDPGLIHVHSCALSGRSGTGRRGTSCAWRAGPPRAATPHKDRCSKGGWAPRRHAGQFPFPDNRWPEGRAAYPA
jgi:tRNA synthetase class I (W and Y)